MKGVFLQLRLSAAIFIFLGSYLPLSVILLARDYEYATLSHPVCWYPFTEDPECVLPLRNPSYSLGIFVTCLICFAITLLVLRLTKAKRSIVILDAKYIPTDLINYALPYVVAFVTIEYHETGKFLGFLVFLAWMFWITYKSGQIILNPFLSPLAGDYMKFPTHSLVTMPSRRVKHSSIASSRQVTAAAI